MRTNEAPKVISSRKGGAGEGRRLMSCLFDPGAHRHPGSPSAPRRLASIAQLLQARLSALCRRRSVGPDAGSQVRAHETLSRMSCALSDSRRERDLLLPVFQSQLCSNNARIMEFVLLDISMNFKIAAKPSVAFASDDADSWRCSFRIGACGAHRELRVRSLIGRSAFRFGLAARHSLAAEGPKLWRSKANVQRAASDLGAILTACAIMRRPYQDQGTRKVP